MDNILIAAAVAVLFIIGWYIVAKTGEFLDKDLHSSGGEAHSAGPLRIGFSDLHAAEGIASGLERFSRDNPFTQVKLFYGTPGEIVQALGDGRLELAFLRPGENGFEDSLFYSREVFLEDKPVKDLNLNMEIFPLSSGRLPRLALWQKGCAGRWAALFVCDYVCRASISAE